MYTRVLVPRPVPTLMCTTRRLHYEQTIFLVTLVSRIYRYKAIPRYSNEIKYRISIYRQTNGRVQQYSCYILVVWILILKVVSEQQISLALVQFERVGLQVYQSSIVSIGTVAYLVCLLVQHVVHILLYSTTLPV